MKVSELWLREWVNPALDGRQIAALLTMAGLEVDTIIPVAGVFDRVVVAQVLKTSPHPQADKLTLCEVYDGHETLQIVCGASNVRAGLNVALAQKGANLPNGLLIKESRLRGEVSHGMLCSASELGLAESSEGILELDENAPIGTDLNDYLFLNDQVFDIDLTPNRADCLSVLGIAREVAALTQSSLKTHEKVNCHQEIDEQLEIQIEAAPACPHYCGRVIRDINPQAITPLWMRERLRRAGLRSIHPVVDVTNYVMLELGQPMHAFDLDKIKGKLIVRLSQEGEKLNFLDGQLANLRCDELIIADQQGPLALAGVMGGSESAVSESTTSIFLESAFFNPMNLAGVARSYGLNTDSSQRFERGVDPGLQLRAIERATALLLEITGGKAGPVSMVTDDEMLPKPSQIYFNPNKVKQLTGLDISSQEMQGMLQSLGMQVSARLPHWIIDVPSHRFDLNLDIDLVEEIIRLYGYDRIPGQKMISVIEQGTINAIEFLGQRLSHFFTTRGYHEAINYSFVDPQLQQELFPQCETLNLLNPISSELSQMRIGLWPGLLAAMVYNTHRQQTAVKLFENGVVFTLSEGKVVEKPCFAGLLTGENGAMSWLEQTRPYDFYDAKGDLQALFSVLKIQNITWKNVQHPALHPGKSAQILTHTGNEMGWCGVLHPRIAEELDLSVEVILFELNLDSLTTTEALQYKAISKFPQIRRDLSFFINESIPAAAIEEVVKKTVNPSWLKAFDVFDVYTGESIPVGNKSLAIALTLQDDNRTLVDTEINDVISAIIKALISEFAINLRD